MIRNLAAIGLALVASAIGSQSTLAQQTCGMQGVTVTVTPECAAPGEVINVTLMNNSNQVITLPMTCLFQNVYSSADCTGNVVLGLGCGMMTLPIPPGTSITQSWDQLNNHGQQVLNGDYSFWISFSGGTCCPSVTIGPAVSIYCTAKKNSLGCTPQINFTGSPSVTDPNPFQVKATQVINNKLGMLCYGFGQTAVPFGGGTLCVEPRITRLPALSSGGNPPPDDCSGRYSFDMNAHIQSGLDPKLTAGASVYAQYWQRDPDHPDLTGVGLTNAVHFCIQY